MADEIISRNMTIDEVVRKYPQTIRTFMNHGLHCIGCFAASYEDIEAGARAHGIDVDALVADLNKALAAQA